MNDRGMEFQTARLLLFQLRMVSKLSQAAVWSGGRITLRINLGFEPRVGSIRDFKIDFLQQKLVSLSIAWDVKA